MKHHFLYSLLILGIFGISNVSYSQEIGLQEISTTKKAISEEENNLKFQGYFFEALKQKAINNFSKAIENLEYCYQIDSTSLAVEFEFSKNYLALKKYVEAEIFVDKALSKEPHNEYLLKHKMLIYKSQRNFAEAIEVQKQLIAINPKYTEYLVALYIHNQEFENANKLIVEVENNAIATTKIIGYKRYLKSREKTRSGSNVKKTISLGNNNLTELKKKYEATKNYKVLQQMLSLEAEQSLFDLLYADSKNGLELYPSQPFLYFNNGLALNKLAKYNEAIAVLILGIDFVIDDADLEANFYEQLSFSYNGLNNTIEALKYKQKAAKLRVKN